MERCAPFVSLARKIGLSLEPAVDSSTRSWNLLATFCKISDAGHTESDPSTSEPVISNLACSLIEADEVLRLVPGSRLHEIYGADEIRETYHCSYGLNPDYLSRLLDGGLRVGVTGPDGEARGLELPAHPFFFATLFQPERSAFKGDSHPLIKAFVAAASNHFPAR